MEKAEWQNTTLIKGNVAEAITKLKQQPGKQIGITGSATLVQSLLQDDLLDELWPLIHPAVVGSGKRLFKDGGDLKRLKLVDSKTFSSFRSSTSRRRASKQGRALMFTGWRPVRFQQKVVSIVKERVVDITLIHHGCRWYARSL
ncbi:MAG: dihydrofolate reductase family protein [Roseiflexaceae bacterium]